MNSDDKGRWTIEYLVNVEIVLIEGNNEKSLYFKYLKEPYENVVNNNYEKDNIVRISVCYIYIV